MKRKILYLILGCITTVVSLVIIQGYFIYNTYSLKEKEMNAEVKKQLFELEETPEYIFLEDLWFEKSSEFIKKQKSHAIDKEGYKKLITKTADSLSEILYDFMKTQEVFKKYKIGYSIYMTSAYLSHNNQTDTLYKGKMLVLGNTIKSKYEVRFASGKLQSKSVEEKDLNKIKSFEDYTSEIKTERYYSIEKWETLIMGKMAGMLVFSFILISFVVVLFYLSIKNLLKEKKLSSIKTDFINNMTHEFQTPLATLEIAVKTLEKKEKQLTTEYSRNSLSIIKRQNERLQKLFVQITEAALASDSICIEPKEIVTIPEIEEIVFDFQISKPEIAICIQAPNKELSIKMNKFHLNTIIVNLLDNAVKYGAHTIEITISNTIKGFQLSIEDDGPGIPKKEQSLIFEKFYRIEKGNIHTTKGLGLGLFYVKQILKAYGGNIVLCSDDTKGSVFIISIPVT